MGSRERRGGGQEKSPGGGVCFLVTVPMSEGRGIIAASPERPRAGGNWAACVDPTPAGVPCGREIWLGLKAQSAPRHQEGVAVGLGEAGFPEFIQLMFSGCLLMPSPVLQAGGVGGRTWDGAQTETGIRQHEMEAARGSLQRGEHRRQGSGGEGAMQKARSAQCVSKDALAFLKQMGAWETLPAFILQSSQMRTIAQMGLGWNVGGSVANCVALDNDNPLSLFPHL